MDQNSQTCIYKQQLPFPGAWEGRINKYETQSISTYSEASKRRKCAAFMFCRALWTICFSHLSFVITWDQISPGDGALCTISLLRKKEDSSRKHTHSARQKFVATETHLSFLLIYKLILQWRLGEEKQRNTHTKRCKQVLPADIRRCLKLSGSWGITESGTRLSVD